ncbi:hypothetical protein ACHQM5_015639 [Ranunculus cassubicifolius]
MENFTEFQTSDQPLNVFHKNKTKNFRKRNSNEQVNDEESSVVNTKLRKQRFEYDNKLLFSTESITRNDLTSLDSDSHFASSREIQVDDDSRATVSLGTHGPQMCSENIRRSTRIDYQQDICKDFKETGYCGFGNACKFGHIREDYRSIEKEWDEEEKRKKRNSSMGVDDDDNEGGEGDNENNCNALPLACPICGLSFVDPVVIKCKHYFCEHCAVKQHLKKKRCFVCDKPTSGIFNTALELKKKHAAEGS